MKLGADMSVRAVGVFFQVRFLFPQRQGQNLGFSAKARIANSALCWRVFLGPLPSDEGTT